MSRQLNSKQKRSLKRAIMHRDLIERAKETEERRRTEKRKRFDDEPNVEYEVDLDGRRVGAPRAKLISLETADESSDDDDNKLKKEPVWNPSKIEGLKFRCLSESIFWRRKLNAMSYGVTKIIPLMRTEAIQPRDRDQKEIERRLDESLVTCDYFGSDSTFKLEVSSSSSSPSSSPSSSSSLSSCSSSSTSSNPFAFKLRPTSKPLSSSSSSSIDSMPRWNSMRTDNTYNAKRRHWRRTKLKL